MKIKSKKLFYIFSIAVALGFVIFILVWKFIDFSEVDIEEIREIIIEKLKDLVGFLLDLFF
jgi:hypothetical protein